MDLRPFLKPGKQLIVELDDGVDYLVSNESAKQLDEGVRIVSLIRLFDQTSHRISARRIFWALQREGSVDYLDSK